MTAAFVGGGLPTAAYFDRDPQLCRSHVSKIEEPISVSSLYGEVAVREFQRGAVRMHILHHAAEHEIHGAWMTKELARHGYDISPGTLYPTLHRLEAEGLLSSVQRLVEGRTRRVYRVTAAGKRALREDRKALEELAGEVLDGQIDSGRGSTPRRSGANGRARGGRG